MKLEFIGPEVETYLTWQGLTEAIQAGHALPRAKIDDMLLDRGKDTLLNRGAWIDGLAQLVKVATIFPGNGALGKPTINGAVALFDDKTGELQALVDFHLVTKWKTAGDSLLSARLLARPDSRDILIVGAGTVARAMVEAYSSVFADARFSIWNRSTDSAERLAASVPGAVAVTDLEAAVRGADIIATATMASEPLIKGAWLRPGTHLDLIGAYKADMREADDNVFRRANLFVDNRETTIRHIGELTGPISRGVISESDILADFYDIKAGLYRRRSADEITVAKNGGGAHLDLMSSHYIMQAWRANRSDRSD